MDKVCWLCGANGSCDPLDKHHIFPKEYLKKQGVELTLINQIANLTYLEYLERMK